MYIKSLQLENVRAFTDLNFDLERPDGSFAGWTVFVGGNSFAGFYLLLKLFEFTDALISFGELEHELIKRDSMRLISLRQLYV